MLYSDFKSIYKKISLDLNLKNQNEIIAATALNKILKKFDLLSFEELKNKIEGKEILVFGAGSSLEKSILELKDKVKNKVIISADGATSALMINNILPDIIVTDLDGEIDDQIKANKKGSYILVHAHGDNIEKVKKFVANFDRNILGTTQINSDSYDNLENFGGFTDGDRAVFLADHFKAKSITLVGFDFDGRIGKYSFPENKDIKFKLKKLRWCEYLIDYLHKKNSKITFYQSNKEIL